MFEASCFTHILFKPPKPVQLAVASSPGLRSVGWGALAKLKAKLKPQPMAEIRCLEFPVSYDTIPTYAAKPQAYGDGGILVENGKPEPPKVKVSYASNPFEALIVEGYHANFYGQYEAAEAATSLLADQGVKRLYILAGYALEGEPVCCAASTRSLLEEAEKLYGLKPGYVGPFLGFSGLLAGAASQLGMEVLCLFGRTTPNPSNPEAPDPEASENLYRKLCEILNLKP
ncbi:MAG: PAC2 family protein [Candidatus Hecatellaceae archaeon]